VDGFLVPVNDSLALAERILELAADPVLRQRLGEKARARAQQFSVRRMMLQYLDLYRELTRMRVHSGGCSLSG